MIAHFARLLIKGVTTACIASIMLHSVVSYTPGGARDFILELRRWGDPLWWEYPTFVVEFLELERPWPFSSLTWLFDPTENERPSPTIEGLLDPADKYVSPGININIAGVPIQGSGVLTGDFGETFMYKRGTPVMDIIGRETDEYLFAHLAILFLAMMIAYLQRRDRPKLHELPGRLLPSLAATRSTVRAGATYIQHAEGPLALLTRL